MVSDQLAREGVMESGVRPSRKIDIRIRQLVKRRSALVGLAIVILLVLCALFAPLLRTHDPVEANLPERFQAPSRAHFFGTDFMGRDVYSRVLSGALISLQVGFISVSIGLLIGVPPGLMSGYYGGRLDTLIMGLVDVMLSFPGILLALVIVAVLGIGLHNVIIAVGIALLPNFARLVRGEALSLRERDFVIASKSMGASDLRIMLRHILPNAIPTIIVQANLSMAGALLVAAGLSFLGLGAQPPTPEWGAMLADGRNYLRTEWWLATFPGIAISLTIIGINLFGDGLRDALDPRLRR